MEPALAPRGRGPELGLAPEPVRDQAKARAAKQALPVLLYES